jgi:methylenetetrahydrofolate reductase (NADPH)
VAPHQLQVAESFVRGREIGTASDRLLDTLAGDGEILHRQVCPRRQAQELRVAGVPLEADIAQFRRHKQVAGTKMLEGFFELLFLAHRESSPHGPAERQTILVSAGRRHYLCRPFESASAALRTFRDAVRHQDFAVSAEIYLRPETDAAALKLQAGVLKNHVDGILLTDNQYGKLHMSTIAAAGILLGIGVDPVVQLSSRNRNRIALVSDLLGAAAIGVTSLLLVAGEKAPEGFRPRPKRVLDLSAADLIRTAKTINKDEKLLSRPEFLIGGAVTPVMPRPNWKPKKLLEKIDAGAAFLLTHLCMDLELLRRYARYLVDHKMIRRTGVIVSVAILESSADATWLRDNRPNVMLPDAILERLDAAQDPAAEGIRICGETIAALRKIPGIDGVNVMASRDLKTIPAALAAAGIDSRD